MEWLYFQPSISIHVNGELFMTNIAISLKKIKLYTAEPAIMDPKVVKNLTIENFASVL